ncbi:MAG: carbohydrate binding family 9 domain-containing protein, partial [Gemmatimonadetes bacterium]|nr:carbohydrate binding family 9 domain-containing protein [Gemmatimonadota bacterium]
MTRLRTTPYPIPALTLALLLAATTARADSTPPASDHFAPQYLPTLAAGRTETGIHVDGVLDDAAWKTATKARGFAETNPGNQTRPPVDSEVWITHDDDNLYVALIAQDDPKEVRASVCDRDQIFQDDYFGVMLDPYGDRTSGYELFVNPLGIQGDLRMLADGNEDSSFDMLWESRGQITDSGYQVEIAIPFSSLRLPERPVQEWRVNFWRDRQRNVRNQYAWAALNRDNPCFMCQWGTLTDLHVGSASRSVEVIGSVIGTQVGSMTDTDDPGSAFENDDPNGDASLSLKYGVSSSTFAELTVNPDFSQVESDAGQIDVNRTFALFFPERRPFFQEGADLYGTWIDAVYTRSINDPSVAAKITRQQDGISGVYTVARDENSPVIIPTEERSEFALLG